MQPYPERGDGGVTLIGISWDEYLKSDEVKAIMARDCIGLRAEARIKKEGQGNHRNESCPQCGETDHRYRYDDGAGKKVNRCLRCRHEWKEK